MKFAVAALLIAGAHAFAPVRFGARLGTARSFGADPNMFSELHHLPSQVDTLQNAFSTFNLADALDAVPAAAADAAASGLAEPAGEVADAAVKSGWFGFLTGPIESLLQVIHAVLVGMGFSENSWGVSILFMTAVIKLLTFPLTKTQLESTNKMQSLQPQIKEVQAKYQSNPEVMNQKISELYQSNDVNPLAGCIPSFIQIPIFIGLYRAVLTLAKDDKLNEPFLFLPSLEGPTYGADPTHGNDWLLQGWVDGVPSLGWDQTTAFLILPVFLVVSQFISMELMQPKAGPDGTKPDSPFILKFLPLMIGWFSLNVPSALCIYWVANNIITTATTLLIRSQMENAPVAVASAPAAAASSSAFAPPPMREKPAGFSAAFEEDPDITPITPTDVIDAEIEVDDSEPEGAGGGMAETGGKKKRNKKKKKRRKN